MEQQRVRIRLVPGDVAPRVLELARQEIDAIWRRYQVELVWEPQLPPDAPRSAHPDLWVQFVDYTVKGNAPGSSSAIAWIGFAEGTPLRYIRVSRSEADRMLRAKGWLDGRSLTTAPIELREVALGLIIGRAIAHEIGHYLLAKRGHAKEGLMRASLSPDRLVRPGDSYFTLEPSDVRALRTARIASCELARR